MIALRGRANRFSGWEPRPKPFICRITKNPKLPPGIARDCLLLVDDPASIVSENVASYRGLCMRGTPGESLPVPSVWLDSALAYLDEDDVVRVSPALSEISVLYRRRSSHNSLLVTERCNSFCVMCSQPPRDIDDSYLIDEVKQTIELIGRDTESLTMM